MLRLWREKRGDVEPEDLSGNLIVQLGLATEKLNRRWYQAQTGRVVTTSNNGADTQRSGGWRRPSMAVSRATQYSRPNSCCRGSKWMASDYPNSTC